MPYRKCFEISRQLLTNVLKTSRQTDIFVCKSTQTIAQSVERGQRRETFASEKETFPQRKGRKET